MRIAEAAFAEDLAAVARLFRAYAESLPVDLAYQNFEAELAGLPGAYAPPSGVLLLARGGDGAPAGCVALKALDPPGTCEMKRLYVAPAARGTGLGSALVDAVVAWATSAGYREMRLDSLPTMAAAQDLYRRRGFTVIAPYYASPVAGTIFMRRCLSAP